jgi:acetyl esterase/lipase
MKPPLHNLSVVLRCTAMLALPLTLPGQPAARPEPPPLRVPSGTIAHRDLAYVPAGHARQKLDLYLPEKSSAPLPLVIWVHGGGWQNGSKDQCLPLRLGFTARGYAVASLNYRLSGHAIFPAQIEDCQAAVRWLRDHAKDYGLDPDRFAAWGASAGGHLVALLGTAGDTSEFAPTPARLTSARVQAVCDFYGPTDLLKFAVTPGYTGHAKPDSPESKLLGGPVLDVPAQARRANPLTYITAGDPPFFILHGSADPTVPPQQSELLHAALHAAGLDSTHRALAGAKHGGPEFSTAAVADEVDAFFRRALKLPPATRP